jgi:hypothetical protein
MRRILTMFQKSPLLLIKSKKIHSIYFFSIHNKDLVIEGLTGLLTILC